MTLKKSIIYAAISAIIACMLFIQGADEHYFMEKNDPVSYEGIVQTKEYSLTAGTYSLILNYAASKETPLAVCVDGEEIKTGFLFTNTEGTYYKTKFTLDESTSGFKLVFDGADKESFELYNFELETDSLLNQDSMYISLAFILLALLIYILLWFGVFQKLSSQAKISVVAMVGLVIFTSYPLFTNYLMYGHDLSVHLMRIEGIKDAFLEGQFPAFVYPNGNNGYGQMGYLYPDYFLWFPALLRCADVSMVTAFHSMLLFVNIVTALATWISVRTITKTYYAPLLATVLYMLSPYRLCDLYFRAAIGEALGMIFFPLVIAGLYHIFVGDKNKWYLLALGYTGLMQAHFISCIMIALLSIGCGVLLIRYIWKESRWISLVKALGTAVLLNAYYLINFFWITREKLGVSTIQRSDFYEYGVFPGQLLMTSVSDYVAQTVPYGIVDEMPLSIGIAGGLSIMVIILYIWMYRKDEMHAVRFSHKFIVVLSAVGAIMLFASTTLFPWKYLMGNALFAGSIGRLMSTIQFSFRFLAVVVAVLAVVGSVAVENTKIFREYKKEMFLLFLCISIFGAVPMMDEFIKQDVEVTTMSGGFSDSPLPEYWPEGTDPVVFEDTDPKYPYELFISEYRKSGSKVSFCYATKHESYIDLPLLYYRGYTATADGEPLAVVKGNGNRLRIVLPKTTTLQWVTASY